MGWGKVMIGHKQIIALRKQGLKPETVFIEFKKPFYAERDIKLGDSPSVYIGHESAKLADLTWTKGLNVQLMPAHSIQQFCEWWVALIKADVNSIVGLDNDGEINAYSKG